MHAVQISDREVFLTRAATCPVTCTMVAEVVPETQADGTVWMKPVLKLYYVLEFDSDPLPLHPLVVRVRWTFVEVQRVVGQQASIAGSLLEVLQSDATYKVTVETRGR